MSLTFACERCVHDGCCDSLLRCKGWYGSNPEHHSCSCCGLDFKIGHMCNLNGELLCERCAGIRQEEMIDDYEDEGS